MRLINIAILISVIVVPMALILYFNYYFRTEFYWLIHILFGFGMPWFMSVIIVFLEHKDFSSSFNMGLVITGIGSISNEYVIDVFNNDNWVFIEQFIQTICDISGMFLAFIFMIYLKKYKSNDGFLE